MTRWRLTRAVIVALAYLSVNAALTSVPGRAIDDWYLYYSPVIIAALSFGLVGSLMGSMGAVVSIFAFYLRVNELAEQASRRLLQSMQQGNLTPMEGFLVGFPGSGATSPNFVLMGDSLLALRSTADVLNQALFGSILIAAVSLVVGWLVDDNRRKASRYQVEARTDELTGVGNYRSLMQALREEIARSRRFDRKFSFLMIDVDGLKPFNDAYGHLVGDIILRELGQLLKEQVRDIDTVARYGGDEFAILLAETDGGGATRAAERLRQAVADHVIRARGIDARVTISIGVVVYPNDGQTPAQLIGQADGALYQAKIDGKNAVVFSDKSWGPEDSPVKNEAAGL